MSNDSHKLLFWVACRAGASYEEKLRLAELSLSDAKTAAVALRAAAAPPRQVTDARIYHAQRLEDQARSIPLERRACVVLCVSPRDEYDARFYRSVEWLSPKSRIDLLDRAAVLRQSVIDEERRQFMARERADQAERSVVYWENMVADLTADAYPT